jgi:alkylhydroperoxidase family enzyme
VAVINKAWYEWTHHEPILKESGFSQEGIDYILKAPFTHKEPLSESPLDEKHASVMQYADAMTKDVEVPDFVFDKLKSMFSDREVVEITATIGTYNCVSRFLVALNVGEMNGKAPT